MHTYPRTLHLTPHQFPPIISIQIPRQKTLQHFVEAFYVDLPIHIHAPTAYDR